MTAKALRVAPIDARRANRLMKQLHYSGSVVQNSSLHLGVFWEGLLRGAMQFGPPMVKRTALLLVRGTPWNGMLELNRMAFAQELPRNSESRAIGVAMRMLRKHRPDIQWVQGYADATQCGDGTIYRAAGFLLVGIKKNQAIWSLGQESFTKMTMTKGSHICGDGKGKVSLSHLRKAGAKPLPGFQLRYVKLLDPTARERLTVPVLPYSKLREVGASMYLGQRAGQQPGPGPQPRTDGATPIPALFPGGPAEWDH